MKLDQFIVVIYVHVHVHVVAIALHASDKYLLQCVWCEDFGLWILHSDLRQPSQTSYCGKNVKVFINGPICKKRAM